MAQYAASSATGRKSRNGMLSKLPWPITWNSCPDPSSVATERSLIPFFEDKPDSNPVHTGVIIQKALAIAVKELEIAVHPLDQGKAPFQLDGAPIAAEVQIVAEHDPEAVPFPEIVPPDLPVPEVVFDVRVVDIRDGLRDAVPALQKKREIAPFKTGTGHDSVPASGQWFGLAVGLMIKAQVYEPALQAQEGIVGPKVDQELRLIIRFPEGGGVFKIVKLPERPLV